MRSPPDAIPVRAEDETLGQWRLHHPDPSRLRLDFNVPTPAERALRIEAWLKYLLLGGWLVGTLSLSWPRFDLFLWLLLVPAGTAWLIAGQRPRVQSLSIDRSAGSLTVVELVGGRPRQRVLPLSEVVSVDYQPARHGSGHVSPASIDIVARDAGESISLKSIGLLRHEELRAWLARMTAPVAR